MAESGIKTDSKRPRSDDYGEPTQSSSNELNNTDTPAPLTLWNDHLDEFDYYVNLCLKTLKEGKYFEIAPLLEYFENVQNTTKELLDQVQDSLPPVESAIGEHIARMYPGTARKLLVKLRSMKTSRQPVHIALSPIEYIPIRRLREVWNSNWNPPPLGAEIEIENLRERSSNSPWIEINAPTRRRRDIPLNEPRSQHTGERLITRYPNRPFNEDWSNWRSNSADDAEERLLVKELREYRTLPPPWNVTPTFIPKKNLFDIGRYVNTAGERKFYGEPDRYPRWRAEFIANLGSIRCLARYKVAALIAALEPILDTLTSKDTLDFKGYKEIVMSLEEKYGERYLQTRQFEKYFEKTNSVTYGNLKLLEEYKIRIEKFLNLIEENCEGMSASAEYIYEKMMNPLASSYVEEYNMWLTASNREEGLEALEEWITLRVKRLRRYPLKRSPIEDKRSKSCLCLSSDISTSSVQKKQDEFTTEAKYSRDKQTLGDGNSEIPEEDALVLFQKMKIPIYEGCPFACVEEHALDACPRFATLKPEKRKIFLRNWKAPICFRCLQPGHLTKGCPTQICCPLCEEQHHLLLHTEKGKSTVLNLSLSFPSERVNAMNPTIKLSLSNVNCEKMTLNVLGLIDTGSTITVIRESIAKRLNIIGRTITITLKSASEQKFQRAELIYIRLHSGVNGQKWTIPALVFQESKLFDYLDNDIQDLNWSKWPHLQQIPSINDNKEELEIGILLGNDVSYLTAVKECITGKGFYEPVAERSLLGWSIRGPHRICDETVEEDLNAATYYVDAVQYKFDKFVERLESCWNLENYDFRSPPLTTIDKENLALVRENVKLVKKKLEAGILWKGKNRPVVPNNRPLALQRYLSLRRYLKRDPKIEKAYTNNIKTWIEERKLIPIQAAAAGSINYLSHFPVIRWDKDSTKVRTVVDAAAKYEGVCINDFILAGPKLSNDVVPVLLRFRREKYAIMGDIKNMFLQIHLNEEDQSYHRLIWGEGDQLSEYQFTVFTFGNCCSPAVAIASAHLLCHQVEHLTAFTRAREAILYSTVMDDTVDSVSTEEEAVDLLAKTRAIYALGSMDFRKMVSNATTLKNYFPPDLLKNDTSISFDATLEHSPMKTLGMLWTPSDDALHFDIPSKISSATTRRTMLSSIAKVYDPLGLVAPLLVIPKAIIQETWTLNLGWDDALPSSVLKKWRDVTTKIEGSITVPTGRALSSHPLTLCERELHIFADASSSGYGAVAYVVTSIGKERYSRLVYAKAKISPLRYATIPRLELQGALEAAILLDTLLPTLKISPEKVCFWTDSMDVLYWLRISSRKLKIFVANRVSEIQARTEISQWNWVCTKDNPADLLTRGTSLSKLQSERLWWKGPHFLEVPEERKTIDLPLDNECHPELRTRNRKTLLIIRVESQLLATLIQISSEWRKLVRIVGIMLGWIPHKRGGNNEHAAERAILRCIQNEVWEDIKDDIKENALNVSHPLSQYRPFLDWFSLIRLRGRLAYAETIPWASRFPIILPKHPLTALLVKHIHETELNHMGGLRTLIARVSCRFFILQGRTLVRNVLRRCLHCRKTSITTSTPRWAPMPEARIPETRKEMFSNCAMDVMGPFLITETGLENKKNEEEIKTKRGRGRPKTKEEKTELVPTTMRRKLYILVLTCMVFRATHLEILDTLSTDDLLLGLERFLAQKNRPSYLHSDNGTNFIGARGLVMPLWDELIQKGKMKFPANQWTLSTPGAAHSNGVIERIVGLTKVALGKALRNKKIYGREFRTAIAMVMGALNNRPLQPLEGDDEDESVLTPNHFLRGSYYNTFVPEGADWDMIQSWTKANEIIKIFWSRFLQEVVPIYNFQNISKGNSGRQWRVGEIVLVKDSAQLNKEVLFPSWPLGRIVETYPTKDGIIRSVKIKMKGSEYVRNVSFIAPLEMIH